ncbi:hypothetical protein AVEN_208189-1 [Araneus ventricosus]|uniref:Uncharacterized protein n=1 Tax=Araneus ventricosus TaxID=182803 RepID=A0A4Y2J092_ARAVE|nr:hypothetical protein AVEN_208189-1 [Araneus ventricosus]
MTSTTLELALLSQAPGPHLSVQFSMPQAPYNGIEFRTWNPPSLPPGHRASPCSCKLHGLHRRLSSTPASRLLLKSRRFFQKLKSIIFSHGSYCATDIQKRNRVKAKRSRMKLSQHNLNNNTNFIILFLLVEVKI